MDQQKPIITEAMEKENAFEEYQNKCDLLESAWIHRHRSRYHTKRKQYYQEYMQELKTITKRYSPKQDKTGIKEGIRRR
jgi:hypothetical protein